MTKKKMATIAGIVMAVLAAAGGVASQFGLDMQPIYAQFCPPPAASK